MNLGKKAIIITGGAGKIGSPLAKSLIKKGYRVLLGDINKVLLQNDIFPFLGPYKIMC